MYLIQTASTGALPRRRVSQLIRAQLSNSYVLCLSLPVAQKLINMHIGDGDVGESILLV
jgi:hypothetical protein